MNDALPSEIRMGNDIMRALNHPHNEQVAAAIATHLKKFWDPRLRRALVENVRLRDSRIDPLWLWRSQRTSLTNRTTRTSTSPQVVEDPPHHERCGPLQLVNLSKGSACGHL